MVYFWAFSIIPWLYFTDTKYSVDMIDMVWLMVQDSAALALA